MSGSFDFSDKDREPTYEILGTENFLQGLAYLANIFNYLNDTNLSLQGSAVTIELN